MATWELTTEYKKSSIERQIWIKDDKVLIREEGYRWGTFRVESDDRPVTDEELRGDDDEWYELAGIENGESWELVDLNDGCWADTEKGRNCTDEDLEEFNTAWEENWYEGVESLGWRNDDTEFYFSGPMKLTNLDTSVEYSGLVDPATVVHTLEMPEVPVLTAEDKDQIIDALEAEFGDKQEAKWPFAPPVVEAEEPELTDWFPVKTKPVRKGIYEILTQESINWPFPNKGEWDGKKWNFLDHTVTHWRGLAKDPGAK
jgi:hypothetical protein